MCIWITISIKSVMNLTNELISIICTLISVNSLKKTWRCFLVITFPLALISFAKVQILCPFSKGIHWYGCPLLLLIYVLLSDWYPFWYLFWYLICYLILIFVGYRFDMIQFSIWYDMLQFSICYDWLIWLWLWLLL